MIKTENSMTNKVFLMIFLTEIPPARGSGFSLLLYLR